MTADSREHRRVEAMFRVRYATVDQLVEAYSADLSKGGMFLATERFLPVNAVIRVHLELGEGNEIPVISRVAYLRDAEAARTAGTATGMGIEFLDLTEERLAQVSTYIATRLGEEVERAAPVPDRKLKVVVVDDDHACCMLAASPFRRRGDEVRLAANGLEALASCLRDPPDVIVSDVHMPKMDGWQLLRLVRSRPTLASVPFIFLSTLNGENDRLRGFQLGVDDYLAKPYRPDELRARVDRLVNRVLQSRQPYASRKSLRGHLDQVSLASVLSFLELEQRTGELLVLGDRQARFLLRNGRLAGTEIDGQTRTAKEGLADLLGWKSGQFEFTPQAVTGDESGDQSITGLLLDQAREDDEATG